jgi:hypothetical protein
MFAKLAVPFLALAALVSAAPAHAGAGLCKSLLVFSYILSFTNKLNSAKRYDFPSFSNYGGYSSLSGFDDFYGVDDFSHAHFSQTVVSEKELVCHSQSIVIIQQRLAVLQEMAKRIITEQICEVETQTIVFEQFHASLGHFKRDLNRYSGYQVGYDSNIVGHFNDFYNSDGSLSTYDFGFSGHDIGSHVVTVGGSNWVDATSPISVGHAFDAAKQAYVSFD